MPLLTCPDCSGQVSDAASACPHCGRPVKSQAVRDREAEEARRRLQAERDAARSPIWPTDPSAPESGGDREREIRRRAAVAANPAPTQDGTGMTKFFVGVGVVVALLWGCSDMLQRSSREMREQEAAQGYSTTDYSIEQAKDRVRATLRDPASAEFSKVRSVNGVVCGGVNARNGFGGMTGVEPFAVTSSEVIHVTRVPVNDLNAKRWLELCGAVMDKP